VRILARQEAVLAGIGTRLLASIAAAPRECRDAEAYLRMMRVAV
jgi:hypothetical protein